MKLDYAAFVKTWALTGHLKCVKMQLRRSASADAAALAKYDIWRWLTDGYKTTSG